MLKGLTSRSLAQSCKYAAIMCDQPGKNFELRTCVCFLLVHFVYSSHSSATPSPPPHTLTLIPQLPPKLFPSSGYHAFLPSLISLTSFSLLLSPPSSVSNFPCPSLFHSTPPSRPTPLYYSLLSHSVCLVLTSITYFFFFTSFSYFPGKSLRSLWSR